MDEGSGLTPPRSPIHPHIHLNTYIYTYYAPFKPTHTYIHTLTHTHTLSYHTKPSSLPVVRAGLPFINTSLTHKHPHVHDFYTHTSIHLHTHPLSHHHAKPSSLPLVRAGLRRVPRHQAGRLGGHAPGTFNGLLMCVYIYMCMCLCRRMDELDGWVSRVWL